MLWAEQIGADHPEYAAKVSHSYELFKEILENHYRTQPVEPTEGCLEVFDLLHEKGINIALTTGFYRQVTDIILARLGWKVASREVVDRQADTWVDFSITSDEVAQGRPAPDMIFRAMQHFGLTDPKQVVNIGDTPSDLASGKAAGCYFSLGLTNGTHTHAQLASHPHDALLPSLHAFKALAVEGFRK
jgi:phosphonatase-like hydrolase